MLCRSLFIFLIYLAFAALPAFGQVVYEHEEFVPADWSGNGGVPSSVDVHNGLVAIGSWGAGRVGSVSIFDSTSGERVAEIVPSDGEPGDRFGFSVALDDGLIAVGSARDVVNGMRSGSVYLFDLSTGEQIAKLLPDKIDTSEIVGWDVDIDDGVVVVGATAGDELPARNTGAAYLFDAATGAQIAKLRSSDLRIGDRFGYSVAIDDGVVVVGSLRADDNRGSVYLFDAATGLQTAELGVSNLRSGDFFGNTVAVDDGTVVVGAQRYRDELGRAAGSVFVFDAVTGVLSRVIPSPPRGTSSDAFGRSVGIDNGIVVVGRYDDPLNGLTAGSAFLFDSSTGDQLAMLLPSNGRERDRFGIMVAIDGGEFIVGASRFEGGSLQASSAYFFEVDHFCFADMSDDGNLNFLDVGHFLTGFLAGDPTADFFTDGELNFLDLGVFLTVFGRGCP